MAINPVFVNEVRQSAFRRRGGIVAAALIVTDEKLDAIFTAPSIPGIACPAAPTEARGEAATPAVAPRSRTRAAIPVRAA